MDAAKEKKPKYCNTNMREKAKNKTEISTAIYTGGAGGKKIEKRKT